MLVGTNTQGDSVVFYDDETLLNTNFWDCDCSHDYIRSVTTHHCQECGSDREDSLISHEVEVQQIIYKHLFQ
jgi:hypothetical protein